MADFTMFLLFSICVLLVLYLIKNNIIRGKKNYPNGPLGLPIVGHLPFFGSYPPKTFLRWWKQYGDVFKIKLGSWDAVVVNGMSLIKEVTHHPKDAFRGRPHFVSAQMLAERTGEEGFAFGNFTPAYVKQHKMVTKSLRLFTSGRPEVIEDLVTLEAGLFADEIIKSCGTIPGFVEGHVQRMIGRIMYKLLFGAGEEDSDTDRQIKEVVVFMDKFVESFGNASAFDVMPWLRFVMPWRVNQMRNLLSNVYHIQDAQVDEHYKTFSRDVIRDVADAILASDADDLADKDRFVLSRDRLNNSLFDLLAASIETTTRTITWTLLYMTAFPGIQNKVHAELDDVVKGRRVSLKDKNDLPFTEAVIMEVSRIVTQLPLSLPHYSIMEAKIGGYDVDKGTVVILNLHSVHHDEKYWGDPECFRPDRFLNNDGTLDEDKCSHVIPFGFGRRRCVGDTLAKMNLFMTFATIMQRCEFIKPQGEVLNLTPIHGLVYRAHDFRALVKERE